MYLFPPSQMGISGPRSTEGSLPEVRTVLNDYLHDANHLVSEMYIFHTLSFLSVKVLWVPEAS